jgi:hypothetical protein
MRNCTFGSDNIITSIISIIFTREYKVTGFLVHCTTRGFSTFQYPLPFLRWEDYISVTLGWRGLPTTTSNFDLNGLVGIQCTWRMHWMLLMNPSLRAFDSELSDSLSVRPHPPSLNTKEPNLKGYHDSEELGLQGSNSRSSQWCSGMLFEPLFIVHWGRNPCMVR